MGWVSCASTLLLLLNSAYVSVKSLLCLNFFGWLMRDWLDLILLGYCWLCNRWFFSKSELLRDYLNFVKWLLTFELGSASEEVQVKWLHIVLTCSWLWRSGWIDLGLFGVVFANSNTKSNDARCPAKLGSSWLPNPSWSHRLKNLSQSRVFRSLPALVLLCRVDAGWLVSSRATRNLALRRRCSNVRLEHANPDFDIRALFLSWPSPQLDRYFCIGCTHDRLRYKHTFVFLNVRSRIVSLAEAKIDVAINHHVLLNRCIDHQFSFLAAWHN